MALFDRGEEIRPLLSNAAAVVVWAPTNVAHVLHGPETLVQCVIITLLRAARSQFLRAPIKCIAHRERREQVVVKQSTHNRGRKHYHISGAAMQMRGNGDREKEERYDRPTPLTHDIPQDTHTLTKGPRGRNSMPSAGWIWQTQRRGRIAFLPQEKLSGYVFTCAEQPLTPRVPFLREFVLLLLEQQHMFHSSVERARNSAGIAAVRRILGKHKSKSTASYFGGLCFCCGFANV